MKYVFVLEDEPKFQKEIVESLHKIDPQLQVRLFDTLKSFADWIRLCAKEGPLSLAKAGKSIDGSLDLESTATDTLVLVVSKEEFLGSQWMGLIRKTRLWLMKKKVCTIQDPTSLVITAFHSPLFDIKLVEDRIINNVIFKPFDKLILEQHLNFAVNGRHPPTEQSLHAMKTSATIEMLKDIQVEAMSEIGMLTRSQRKITPGAVSKYYGEVFKSQIHKSMIAICRSCVPHPQHPTEYLCEFRFFSPDSGQVSMMRKFNAQETTEAYTYNWFKDSIRVGPPSENRVQIVAIEADEKEQKQYQIFFKEFFQNVTLTFYKTVGEFQHQLDPPKKKENLQPAGTASADDKTKQEKVKPLAPLPLRIDIVTCDHFGFQDDYKSRWEKIKELVQQRNKTGACLYTMVAPKHFSSHEQREFANHVDDIFIRPFDPVYLARKLKFIFPELETKKPMDVLTFCYPEKIQVANPIEVTELSEAGIVMKYHRPITIGSFRKFILWREKEIEIPELLGSCNYVVEGAEESHQNHFVFFGVADYDLKHIRKWILDNYIKGKEAA